MKIRVLLMLAFGALVSSEVRASEPCCNVTAVDARSGVVTARETATGRTFQFKLDDTGLASAIKAEQTVEADFKTMKVTVRPAEGEPCCSITAAVPPNSVVTLRVISTGRTFQMTVRDARLLGTLKVGQTVDANEGTGAIAVAPTGTIVK